MRRASTMFRVIGFTIFFLLFSLSRASPNPELAKKLLGSRYSNDIFEDAMLDVVSVLLLLHIKTVSLIY